MKGQTTFLPLAAASRSGAYTGKCKLESYRYVGLGKHGRQAGSGHEAARACLYRTVKIPARLPQNQGRTHTSLPLPAHIKHSMS